MNTDLSSRLAANVKRNRFNVVCTKASNQVANFEPTTGLILLQLSLFAVFGSAASLLL